MEKTIHNLVHKYKTSDPVALAKELGIIVLFENLGSIRGYYNRQKRQKFIHINNSLSYCDSRFTAAHELGHAILHSAENTPFLRENTLFSVSKLETQANKFAIALLTYNIENKDKLTINQLSALSGVDSRILIRYMSR